MVFNSVKLVPTNLCKLLQAASFLKVTRPLLFKLFLSGRSLLLNHLSFLLLYPQNLLSLSSHKDFVLTLLLLCHIDEAVLIFDVLYL